MEVKAGARMRPCTVRVGQRCRYASRCSPLPPAIVSVLRRRFYAAAATGKGPSGVTPPGDVNESLAPVIFRFGDATATSPAASSSNGHTASGAKWSNIIPTGGSGMVGGTGLGHPTAAAASSFVDSTRTVGSATTSGGTATNTSNAESSAQTHTSKSGQSFSHSYSDHYRQSNTSFTRPGAPNTTDDFPGASLSTTTSNVPNDAADSTSLSATIIDGAPGVSGVGTTESAEVAAALARAQAALERAETSLEDIQRLNSSLDAANLQSLRATEPPSRWAKLLAVARSGAAIGAMAFAMLATHAFGLAVQWVGAAAGAAAIAGWGLRRGALAPSGAAAAFLVGFGTLGASLRLGATLVAFFLSSSKLTRYKEELKEGLEEGAKKGGQRTWVQVLCNGLVPTIFAVVYGILAGCVDLPLGPAFTAAAGPTLEPWRAAALTGLMGGFLGYYACCCGDTWASELGALSADTPRLITSMRPVRRGTNGGVTLLGLSASIMGGMFVGLVFYLGGLLSPTLWIFESQRAVAVGQWRLIPLGLMAGLFGSALDSLLGATLQYSGYDTVRGCAASRPGPNVVHISGTRLLDNNAVNAVSASLTAVLTALVALKSFGF